MTPAARQIVFINTAHTITHYSLLILPTAVLAMAVPGGAFGASYGPILALATGGFVFYGLLSLPQGWLAQRFAIDWLRIGPNGLAFHDDPAANGSWAPYGAEVLAVANGRISNLRDGVPENDPTSEAKAVPINLETASGNYIIIDLGGGRYAFYAHLQPGSLRVHVGDHVKEGQTIALLGNSGNADAPHLQPSYVRWRLAGSLKVL